MNRFSKKGQVTLLVILLGLLGVTVGLSAVSRSLSDFHQTTQTNSGSQALAAAEAVAEYAVGNRKPATIGCSTATFTPPSGVSLPPGIRSWGYKVCADTNAHYLDIPNVNADDVVNIDLTQIAIGVKKAEKIKVLWNSNTSILVSYLDRFNNLTRSAYNGSGVVASNQFSTPTDTVAGCNDATYCPGLSKGYQNCQSFVPSVQSPGGFSTDNVFRIRTLYSSSPVMVCIGPAVGNDPAIMFGEQEINFIGQATSTDGTVRTVQRTAMGTGLPGIFDYSLYSEDKIEKN